VKVSPASDSKKSTDRSVIPWCKACRAGVGYPDPAREEEKLTALERRRRRGGVGVYVDGICSHCGAVEVLDRSRRVLFGDVARAASRSRRLTAQGLEQTLLETVATTTMMRTPDGRAVSIFAPNGEPVPGHLETPGVTKIRGWGQSVQEASSAPNREPVTRRDAISQRPFRNARGKPGRTAKYASNAARQRAYRDRRRVRR